ncbi:MAG: methionine--tRNA ligase [Dehalococcoidia bacterium]
MPETIFLGVAWPYANGPLHAGHIAGAYLPADIFARYHRLCGDRVLMVSGSDAHGTPVTVRAEQEGRSPQAVLDEFHTSFLDTWQRLGISFDLFTSTSTENHARVAQELFLRLMDKDYIYQAAMDLPYCPVDRRFLLDRYVEGTCPHCGYTDARGDQCENCGRTLDPIELIDARCRFCGSAPEIRSSEHFFLRLTAFPEPLRQWLETKESSWRKWVVNESLGFVREGLRDRSITRDLTWGVPVPVPGWEDKRLYVWFEAVIGYLSATIEWAERQGTPEAWRDFWQNPDCRGYYFIGKDNVTFHTIIWPAMIMGYGDLNLAFNVPANQFVTLKSQKLSTSRNWAVWMPEYLDRYDPDPLRYYLSVNMPETSDTDFTWQEYFRRNNDELVATWGNLVNRVLSLTYRNFDRAVPEPGELGERDRALLDESEQMLADVGDEIGACRFRAGITRAMAFARETNGYLDQTAPWKAIREDRPAAARSLYTAIAAIDALKTALSPFLPFTCARLHDYLHTQDGSRQGWYVDPPRPGQALAEPKPLFRKFDPEQAEVEEARLAT